MNSHKIEVREVPGECPNLRDTGSTFICLERGSAYCLFRASETGYIDKNDCPKNPANVDSARKAAAND